MSFRNFYINNLHGKTIEQTLDLMVDQYDGITMACTFLLTDIGHVSSKSYSAHHAEMLRSILVTYYPTVRWGAIHSIHEGIMNGGTELKNSSVGSIVQMLRKVTDQAVNLHTEHERQSYPEEQLHKNAYLAQYPDHQQIADQQMPLDEFLALHDPGTFTNLEALRGSKDLVKSVRKIFGMEIQSIPA